MARSIDTKGEGSGLLADGEDALLRDGARTTVTHDRAELRALLSSARHAIGSPLHAVQGFSELLESEAYGVLGVDQRAFLQHVLTGTAELRSALDACFELAELELLAEPHTCEHVDLSLALADTLSSLRLRGLGVVPGPRMTVALDRAMFRRAFEALTIAMSVGDGDDFVVAIRPAGEYALVSLARTAHTPHEPAIAFDQLARTQRITRHLIWFRLARSLLSAQRGQLALSPTLAHAELRVPLTKFEQRAS